MPTLSHLASAARRAPERWVPVAALLCAALIAVLVPHDWLRGLDLVGYAVCHRISDRSFIVGGTQLPVCSRDTGMFGMALLSILTLAVAHPGRVSAFPSGRFALVLAGLAGVWVVDGFNSYALLATRDVLWYMPQNWLRLVTGAGMGTALGSFVLPFFNQSVWALSARSRAPSIGSWRMLALVLGVAAAWVAVVLWQPAVLYGAFALISALGAVGLLTVVNSLLVVLIGRNEARLVRWRQFGLPLVIGLALTAAEIAAIDSLRAYLTQLLNLPY